jgi:enoyl-CoA hydratase/carnithine racemase
VVPHENLIETAEQYASIIMCNSQQAIRSAKETILDVVGRTLDDTLRVETLNSYSSLGDFSEARERLSQFYSKGKGKQKA